MEVSAGIGVILVGVIVVGHYIEDRLRNERRRLWTRYVRGPSSVLAIGYAFYLYWENQPKDALFVGGIGLLVLLQVIYRGFLGDSK